MWKELFKQKCDELNHLNVDINAVLHRGSSLYVCRTCFSALDLESYLQKKKALLQNMENAIEKISLKKSSMSMENEVHTAVNQPSTSLPLRNDLHLLMFKISITKSSCCASFFVSKLFAQLAAILLNQNETARGQGNVYPMRGGVNSAKIRIQALFIEWRGVTQSSSGMLIHR